MQHTEMAWKFLSGSVCQFMNSRLITPPGYSGGSSSAAIYIVENVFSSKREQPKIDTTIRPRHAPGRTLWQIAFKTRFTRTEVPFGRHSLQKRTAAPFIRAPKSLIRELCLAIDHEFFSKVKMLFYLFSHSHATIKTYLPTLNSHAYIFYIFVYTFHLLFTVIFHVFQLLYSSYEEIRERRNFCSACQVHMLKCILFPCEIYIRWNSSRLYSTLSERSLCAYRWCKPLTLLKICTLRLRLLLISIKKKI